MASDINELLNSGLLEQVSLEMFATKERMGARAKRVLKVNKLNNLYLFFTYYMQHRTFMMLNNAGDRTDYELRKIFRKYKLITITQLKQLYELPNTKQNTVIKASIAEADLTPEENSLNEITTVEQEALYSINDKQELLADLFEKISLDMFSKIENLSVRASNILRDNGINTFYKLFIHYENNGNILKFKNAGATTDKELAQIVKKYLNMDVGRLRTLYDLSSDIDATQNVVLNPNDLSFDNLTSEKITILDDYIKNRIAVLSTRASNALIEILGNDITAMNYLNLVVMDDKNLKSQKNIGKASISEIRELSNEYLTIANDLLNNNRTYKATFSQFQNIAGSVFEYNGKDCNFYFDENGLKVFSFFNFVLFQQNCFMDIYEKEILQFNCSFQKDVIRLTYEEIALKHNISRERVRQIKESVLKKLHNSISIFSLFNDFINYGSDLSNNNDFIFFNNEIVDRINSMEETNFSVNFIASVFSIIFKASHILFKPDKNNIDLSAPFLTSVATDHYFDMNAFLKSVTLDSKKIDRTFLTPKESYLKRFATNIALFTENYDHITSVANNIIIYGFGLSVDDEDNIVFYRTTQKKRYEYIIDILKEVGTPLNIREIFEKLTILYPEAEDASLGVIRSDLNKFKEYFIYMRGGADHESKYALKEMETNNTNIKGGSIRDIIYDHLYQSEKPLHLDQITKHIQQFRDTNSANIFGNIKLDEHNRFTMLPLGFIGLKNKRYGISLSNKKFPGRFRDISKLTLSKLNKKCLYSLFIDKVTLKFGLNKDMVKLVLDKEIEDGVYYLENDYLCLTDIVVIKHTVNLNHSKSDFLYNLKSGKIPNHNDVKCEDMSDFLLDVEPAQEGLQVDFLNPSQKYDYTKPFKLTIFETTRIVNSWSEVLVRLCDALIAIYPDIINSFEDKCLRNGSKIYFTKNQSLLLNGKKLSNGLWVEANISSPSIIRLCKTIIDKCGVNPADVKILYVSIGDTSIKKNKESQLAQHSCETEKKPVIIENVSYYMNQKEFNAVQKKYIEVLDEYFPNGLKTSGSIQVCKFISKLQQHYPEEIFSSNEIIIRDLANISICCENSLYISPNTIIEDGFLLGKILQFVLDAFRDGKKAVYFDGVFNQFRNELIYSKVCDSGILKELLRFYFGGSFFFQRNCILISNDVIADASEEVEETIKNSDAPISKEFLLNVLPHISERKINEAIAQKNSIIYWQKNIYWHIEKIEITRDDIDQLREIIWEQTIDGFVSIKKLYELIKINLPQFIDYNDIRSHVAFRDILKYYFSEEFGFKFTFIGAIGEDMSGIVAVQNFIKGKEQFTLSELFTFVEENDLPPMYNLYIDDIKKNYIRVDEDNFLLKEKVSITSDIVIAIQNATKKYLSSGYAPLLGINSFILFPWFEFQWNIYLLQSIIEQNCFDLTVFTPSCTVKKIVGVIADNSFGFNKYEDILIEELTKQDKKTSFTDEQTAIDYLFDNGYISQRRMSDFGRIFALVKLKNAQHVKLI